MMAADLILTNAAVLTMHREQPWAEAVAVADGRIVGVGRAGEIAALRGPRTRVIDCGGRVVMPGVVDAHMHLLSYAAALVSVDCSPGAVRSISEIQTVVRQRAAALPAGTWIRATGYDETALAERRHPTRHDLDAATPLHPVRLLHRSGHAVVLNSLALRLAGITNETPEPPGGYIDRDLGTGEPTGLLLEMNAIVDRVVPPLAEADLKAAVAEASRRLLAEGVTTIQDATATNGPAEHRLFQQLVETGSLLQRVLLLEGYEAFSAGNGSLPSPDAAQAAGCDRQSTMRGEREKMRLRWGAVKIMLRELGDEVWPPVDRLAAMVSAVHRSGRQVAIHAVGRSAVAVAVAALEQVLAGSPRRDHRHRIEHCGVCPPELAERLGRLGVIVVTQPAFLYYNGDRYLQTVPSEDLPHLYPLRRLWQAGVTIASSSDAPVAPPAFMPRLSGVVDRRSRGGQVLGSEQRLAMSAALRMATVTAAYAGRLEDSVGRIAPGYTADLLVLTRHPLVTPPERLHELGIETAILGGHVYHFRQQTVNSEEEGTRAEGE